MENRFAVIIRNNILLMNRYQGDYIELIQKSDTGEYGVKLIHINQDGRRINRGIYYENTGALPGDKAPKGFYNTFKNCQNLDDVERVIRRLPVWGVDSKAGERNMYKAQYEQLKPKYDELITINKKNYDAAVQRAEEIIKLAHDNGYFEETLYLLLKELYRNRYVNTHIEYCREKFEKRTGRKIEFNTFVNEQGDKKESSTQTKQDKKEYYNPEDDPNSVEGMTRRISEETPLLKRGSVNLSNITERELGKAINMLVVDSGMLPNTPLKRKRRRPKKLNV